MDYSKSSCTMNSTRYTRVHYIREDKQLVADHDVINASVLRIFQQKLDERSRELRKAYGFSVEELPPDEWLWIDTSLREMASWGCKVRGKTAYARALQPMRRSERQARSLVELGYIKTRWIARRNNKAKPCPVATDVYRDALDRGLIFIVVLDEAGNYLGREGAMHNALEEGYEYVHQQYLYCFEKFNAAIAELDGLSLPEPVRRWNPAHRNVAPAQETKPALDAHGKNMQSSDVKEVSIQSDEACIFQNQNIILPANASSDGWQSTKKSMDDSQKKSQSSNPGGFKSLIRGLALDEQHSISSNEASRVDDDLRRASWTPETIIALSSRHLNVPPKPTAGKALTKWNMDWQEPAAWIIAVVGGREPSHAWEVADRLIQAAKPGGPTWYAEHFNPSDLTLRHIVGWDKALLKQGELRLTGDNWRKLQREVDNAPGGKWYPDRPVPYDGPPLEDEQRYTGVTQAIIVPTGSGEALPLPVVEEPARPAGMTQQAADELFDDIASMYPALASSMALGRRSEQRYTVGIRTSERSWFDFYDRARWEQPDEEVRLAIEAALLYADPPVIEASPIILDAETLVAYQSIEEIEADLRGSPPVAQFPQPTPTATPPKVLANFAAKEGLDRSIAKMMLDSLAKSRPDIIAQLHPLENGRYVIQVDNASIDSGAAWSRYLMAAMNSSGVSAQALT